MEDPKRESRSILCEHSVWCTLIFGGTGSSFFFFFLGGGGRFLAWVYVLDSWVAGLGKLVNYPEFWFIFWCQDLELSH